MNEINTHSDQFLIDGLVNNDSEVIIKIYKQYSPKIYSWIQQNSGDYEQAQDIFQEALVDIYRKASQQVFQLTCPFEAFLFVIVRNKWFSELKKTQNRQVTNLDDSLYSKIKGVEEDAEKIIQYENQFKLLNKTLNELQEGCKELLKLSWTGLGMEEVGEKLNMTYAYVRKKKSLCMSALIEKIKNSDTFAQLSFIN